jgi:hypothetical protein
MVQVLEQIVQSFFATLELYVQHEKLWSLWFLIFRTVASFLGLFKPSSWSLDPSCIYLIFLAAFMYIWIFVK